MQYIQVSVEHETLSLSEPFLYSSRKPVQPGCRVFVPFGRQKLTGMVMEVVEKPENPGFRIREILEVIDPEPILSQEQLSLARKLAHDTISAPMQMINCMLPSSISLRKTRAKAAMETWLIKKTAPDAVSLSPAQSEALRRLPDQIPLRQARSVISDYMVQTLVNKGLLSREKRTASLGALPKQEQVEWPELNDAQSRALEELKACEQRVRLLYGITGSGKTELYYHLAKEALEAGKQVLILVPEIVLTPMMENRFLSRFDVDIFSFHSRLSSTETLSVWNAVESAGPCIVIGTRKSVFLPFSNLGLVIMDEEHDSSYKQENAPRYHARDAALMRAESFDCPLILGSATPSLDTYARALKGVYGLVELETRALNQESEIRLLDLRYQPVYSNFSGPLIKAIKSRIDKQEKSMILLNRRGYLPVVRCLSCNEYLRCEDCNIPLSYHKAENMLVCHVCGRRYPLETKCPCCGSENLQTSGQGTERLEEDTRSLFPQASIVRMDHDTTSRKGEHQKRLEQFEQEGDILLGTQMIAKGLDFHDITLCGILSIDTLLSRPDYLACERAYQLAEQAAGRAGRGDKRGLVYIQTYMPEHFVLQSVLHHDYKSFFRIEMDYRRQGANPPYTYMATVVLRHSDPVCAYNKALEMRSNFEACGINVLGPAEISMRNKQSRFRLILRTRDDPHLIKTLWQASDWFGHHGSGCRVDFNVHPMNLEE